LITIKKLSI